MKRFIFLLLILAGIGAYFYFPSLSEYIDRWARFSFCDTTIHYKLGTIDPEFETESKAVLADIEEAAEIWNELLDKDLFVYDSTSDLTIDLVFDERQSVVNKINEERAKVDSQKAQYEEDLKNFETEKARVQATLDNLNQEIQYWNSKGGAPEGIFEDIIKKQEAIQKDIDRINNATDAINNAVDEINNQIGKVNNKVNDFNEVLEVKPEEGLYIGGENRIEIYIYDDKKSFIHTTAHELGHALGLDHVEVENAIMNPTSSPESAVTDADKALLSSFCTEQNKIELVKNDFKNLFYMIFSDINNVLPLST